MSISAADREGKRFCGLPDVIPQRGGMCRWSKRQLVYGFRNDLPGISFEQMRAVFQDAWNAWASVCNLQAEHISTTGTPADVVIDTGHVDGPANTLAYSEMPCASTDRVLEQRYDSAEAWSTETPAPQNYLSLYLTALHELGHAIGIPHLAAGNLMQPTYSSRITELQPGDIREAQRRYGPPKKTPPDPIKPVAPGGGDLVRVTLILPRDQVIIE